MLQESQQQFGMVRDQHQSVLDDINTLRANMSSVSKTTGANLGKSLDGIFNSFKGNVEALRKKIH
jgi:hypothetical protein